MGVEASYQAIPDPCDLLTAARENLAIAEALLFLKQYARPETLFQESPEDRFVARELKQLLVQFPDLLKEHFYAGGRNFDAIIYLLSAHRREANFENDPSMIYKAVLGSELLHPEAAASQGRPIRFCPAPVVREAAAYLDSVSPEDLREHLDPKAMYAAAVYKSQFGFNNPEEYFADLLDEFHGMRDLYLLAAENGRAMIVSID
ncbi:MAG: YfbM family protein [bacterium]|nr:YfbM family protein [bacterium]